MARSIKQMELHEAPPHDNIDYKVANSKFARRGTQVHLLFLIALCYFGVCVSFLYKIQEGGVGGESNLWAPPPSTCTTKYNTPRTWDGPCTHAHYMTSFKPLMCTNSKP